MPKAPTIFTNKSIFMKKYQQIKKEVRDDDEIIQRTTAQLDGFNMQTATLKATFDLHSDSLDPITVLAFCIAFDVPFDDSSKDDSSRLVMFRRKRNFLKLYNPIRAIKSEAEICKEMNDYCYIPPGTLHDTASSQKTSFNTTVALAFCKTYGFDIDDIFRDESSGEQKTSPPPIRNDVGTVDPELPNGFEGRFYGYFFNSTPDYTQQGKLDQFVLDISSREITMTLRHFGLNDADIYTPKDIVMPGKIIHNGGGKSSSGFLVIAFNSTSDNSFCTLAYRKLHLNENSQLRFRKGAMLIHSRGGDERMPVIQAFIFTSKKIDLEIESNRTILQGALALTGGKIWLRKNDLDAYRNSAAMREYFRRVPLESALREFVEVSENILLDLDIRDKDEKNELYKILLQMKADAVNPRLFSFPNTSADRSWRCVTALGKEESQETERESQVFCGEEPNIGTSGRIPIENLTFSQEAELSQGE